MACILAENVGVERPKKSHVQVEKSYPSLSQMNTPFYACTQRVAVLIGNGFNDKEVENTLNVFQQYGVFIEVVSENLGTITGVNGTKIEVDKTFITTYPILYDSQYVVGGNAKNEANFHQNILTFVNEAYKHYKPIGIASIGQSYIHRSDKNNLAGIVFATNNPNFESEFISPQSPNNAFGIEHKNRGDACHPRFLSKKSPQPNRLRAL
ncbi:DJ-1/PfpI family protein [Oceanobacillus rekensis]|uniref:DJ-1/PfpI family protein n=1 Tax=Oceanobacillus rekensis TaxID=937927 RepID=UPI003182E0ED